MKEINILPTKITVFPLSNFIIFLKTTVTYNIDTPRTLHMELYSSVYEQFS